MTSEKGAVFALGKLVDAATAGHFTLPEPVLDAWATRERVRAITSDEPAPLHVDTAAAQVFAATAAGEPVDVVDLARQVRSSAEDCHAHDMASRVRRAAVEMADNAARIVASEMTEVTISEHLRPALDDVYAQARRCAADLAGFGLEPRALLTAPAKARSAFAALGGLVDRRNLLFEARSWVNAVGHRVPTNDEAGMFAEFENPMVLVPGWQLSTAPWPGVPAPEDPVERLLWVASDGVAPARPWLPTVAELDAAYWKVFGAGIEMRAQAQRDSEAIGARGVFVGARR
ncbi:hypothetical protein BH24ACT5_BH24ACT5_20100 [soil metagenome]